MPAEVQGSWGINLLNSLSMHSARTTAGAINSMTLVACCWAGQVLLWPDQQSLGKVMNFSVKQPLTTCEGESWGDKSEAP